MTYAVPVVDLEDVQLEAVRAKFWVSGHGSCPGGPCLLRFPGVLLSRWPLRACCYRRGSADAARSRATDPAATRAEPAAILGLRRCTARAARRTPYTAFGASMATASTVSRRGWRRRHDTSMTIHATGETSSYRRKNRDSRRAAGVSVPAVAGACVPGLRIRSICCRKFSCTWAGVGASVPRPHATSPLPREIPGRAITNNRNGAGHFLWLSLFLVVPGSHLVTCGRVVNRAVDNRS
jgi:hypothetical protein